jgi:hypothetical protein
MLSIPSEHPPGLETMTPGDAMARIEAGGFSALLDAFV